MADSDQVPNPTPTIEVRCSGCSRRLKAKSTMIGKTATCPACGTKVLIQAQTPDKAVPGLEPISTTKPSSTAAPKKISPVPEEVDLGLGASSPDLSSFNWDDLPPATPRRPLSSPVSPLVSSPVSSGFESPIGSNRDATSAGAENFGQLNRLMQGGRVASPAASPPRPLPPLRAEGSPGAVRQLHWFLVLALLPLAFSIVRGLVVSEETTEERFIRTLSELSENERQQLKDNARAEVESEVSLFDILPNKRIDGALLSRNSYAHWLFAAVSAGLFFTFLRVLASDKSADPLHLVGIGFFTATCGICFLLMVQTFAGWSQGVWIRGRGLLVLIFFIFKFIGFSYEAALDPENGFLLSFFGFTCGVGFCEEFAKCIPLLFRYREENNQTWRGAFIWGLASGAGFGIAEGIHYASGHYNGIAGAETYLIRFISCVALHAVWCGSVGITVNQNQEMFQQEMEWYEAFVPLLRFIWAPMILHGLYDTLLKKDMEFLALIVAFASFGYLAFQINRVSAKDQTSVRPRFATA